MSPQRRCFLIRQVRRRLPDNRLSLWSLYTWTGKLLCDTANNSSGLRRRCTYCLAGNTATSRRVAPFPGVDTASYALPLICAILQCLTVSLNFKIFKAAYLFQSFTLSQMKNIEWVTSKLNAKSSCTRSEANWCKNAEGSGIRLHTYVISELYDAAASFTPDCKTSALIGCDLRGIRANSDAAVAAAYGNRTPLRSRLFKEAAYTFLYLES